MSLIQRIKETTAAVIGNIYGVPIVPQDILVNQTKPEFEGDYTVVLFALVKQLKKSPEALGQELGRALVDTHADLYESFSVIKGFFEPGREGQLLFGIPGKKLCK